MYRYLTFIPDATDAPPKARMGGPRGDIPIVDLRPDRPGDVQVQFQPVDYDAAVAWLDHLADEASGLAAKIRVRQQQDARLLAAVEAAPGGVAR